MARDRKIVEQYSIQEYATFADVPAASEPGPSIVYVRDTGTHYKQNGSAWSTIDSAAIYAPDGFNWPAGLPEVIVYKNGDKFTCNIGPDDLIDPTLYTGRVYVDGSKTVDTGDGLTWATAKQKISSAKTVANSLAVPTKILVAAGVYPRTKSFQAVAVTPTVPMYFEAVGGRVITGSFEDLTITLVGGGTYAYQATRSAVTEIYNPMIFEKDGTYKRYDWVASAALVETTEGSWFTDNVTIYVHPHGNVLATNRNVRAYMTSPYPISQNANFDMLVRGFDMEGGAINLQITAGSTNTIVADNCTFRYSLSSNLHTGGATYSNAVQVIGACKFLALYNCQGDQASQDIFNVHGGVTQTTLLTVNCKGFKSGAGASTSNNGLTIHDGCVGIDIGGQYEYSYGSNVGITGANTQLWCVGTKAGGSIGDIPLGGTINYGGFAAILNEGCTLWLDSCEDWGCDIGVYAGTDATVYLRNHKGSGTRTGNILDY